MQSFSDWWTTIAPWAQGLFGGAGAVLLWEAVLKPVRERRSLAHVLSEEVWQNLEYAAGQRLYWEKEQKALPDDFVLGASVFHAVAPRVGELGALVGEVVLFYRRVEALNKLPPSFAAALSDYHNPQGEVLGIELRRYQAKAQMDSILSVYRTGLESLVQHGEMLFPRLQRASWPWYRIDLWLRGPKQLDMARLARSVEQLAELRRADRAKD